MSNGKTILGLVGSPRTDGLTNQLVSSALEGAARAGSTIELVQMSEYVVDACKDCLPWVCADNLKCTYEDGNLEVLSEKLLSCDGLVLGTPVYWGDTTAMVRLLILKIFRVYARTQPLLGIPAYGIAIAGGSGNGLVSGLRPLYHFFRTMWMRAIQPLPVTRFDLKQANATAGDSGYRLARMAKEPFENRDDRDFWYDNLPYLADTNAEERRLLTAVAYKGVPKESKAEVQGDWAEADILFASGRTLESMTETSKIYDSSDAKVSKG
ncbi:flavodoxin family protein [Chloroflexota bacterium]